MVNYYYVQYVKGFNGLVVEKVLWKVSKTSHKTFKSDIKNHRDTFIKTTLSAWKYDRTTLKKTEATW